MTRNKQCSGDMNGLLGVMPRGEVCVLVDTLFYVSHILILGAGGGGGCMLGFFGGGLMAPAERERLDQATTLL